MQNLMIRYRREYHRRICKEIIRVKKDLKKGDYPNFADGDSKSSRSIAWEIFNRVGCAIDHERLKAQTIGKRFENATSRFIENVFEHLNHLRPGRWQYLTTKTDISKFDQYEHLAHIKALVSEDKILGSALGGNYLVKPDIVISRSPVTNDEINRIEPLVNTADQLARHTPLRKRQSEVSLPILHASISCKWTTRNDRAQNTRTEALNLIRNRKGKLPHIMVVTAEPLPMRIASLALGTGDLDCVYHFALDELKDAVQSIDNQDQMEMLEMMIDGRRLRDISDLPFDLAI